MGGLLHYCEFWELKPIYVAALPSELCSAPAACSASKLQNIIQRNLLLLRSLSISHCAVSIALVAFLSAGALPQTLRALQEKSQLRQTGGAVADAQNF